MILTRKYNIMQLTGENMLKTTAILIDEYRRYQSPRNKISRAAEKGDLIPLVRGLYETDPSVPGFLLAGCIYGPSYLSFEFALARYGLIRDRVYAYTSATFGKKKKKQYRNAFGTYLYRDVPDTVFPMDILVRKEGEYFYQIASPEKALCDTLYAAAVFRNKAELRAYLFDEIHMTESSLMGLNSDRIEELAEGYHCTNLKLLERMMRN